MNDRYLGNSLIFSAVQIYNINIISMSQKYSQQKIRVMGQKYKKFLEKQNNRQQRYQLVKRFQKFKNILQSYWCKIIPITFRACRSQYELFSHIHQKQFKKKCVNQLISQLSVQQNLQIESPKVNGKIVIGLVYHEESIVRVVAFLNKLKPEEIQVPFIICPIHIEESLFRQYIQRKIGYYNESIIVFWKGLFHQMIILNKYKIIDRNIWQRVHTQIKNRQDYEKMIKGSQTKCSANQSTEENSSGHILP